MGRYICVRETKSAVGETLFTEGKVYEIVYNSVVDKYTTHTDSNQRFDFHEEVIRKYFIPDRNHIINDILTNI